MQEAETPTSPSEADTPLKERILQTSAELPPVSAHEHTASLMDEDDTQHSPRSSISGDDDLEDDVFAEKEKKFSLLRCLWSIKLISIIVFGLMIVITALSIWLVGFLTSTETLSQGASHTRRYLIESVNQYVTRLLIQGPATTNYITQQFNRDPSLHPNHISSVTQAFRQQRLYFDMLKSFPQVSIIYFGDEETGGLVSIQKFPGYARGSVTDNQRYLHYYIQDEITLEKIRYDGNVSNYNSKTRDWYTSTVLNGGNVTWTSPFLAINVVPQLSINNGIAIYNQTDRSLLGVISASFRLSEINGYLSEFERAISDETRLFILERDLMMIASSRGVVHKEDEQGRPVRISGKEHLDYVIRDTTNFIESKLSSFTEGNARYSFEFSSGGMRSVEILDYRDENGLNWIIIAVLAHSDIYGNAILSNALSGGISVVVLALAAISSLILGLIVTRPVEIMSKQMKKIGDMDFSDKSRLSNLYEFLEMEHALIHMKRGLKNLKKYIPKDLLENVAQKKGVNLNSVESGSSSTQDMCVAYVNIQNFHLIMKQCKDSKEIFGIINSYIKIVAPIIQSKGGYIAKHFGAGILVVFQDVTKAIYASVRMQKEIQSKLVKSSSSSSSSSSSPQKSQFQAGISVVLYSGSYMIGTIGSNKYVDGCLLSENMALLSLLHALARQYHSKIVTTSDTLSKVSQKRIATRSIGTFVMKDMDQEYEVVEILEKYDTNLHALFSKAISIVKSKGRYDEAYQSFQRIIETDPSDELSQAYLNMCRQLIEESKIVKKSITISEVLVDTKLRDSFEQFCNMELSGENIAFWYAIEEYRKIPSAEDRYKRANEMYKEFLSMDGSRVVNVNEASKKVVKEKLDSGDGKAEEHLFNRLQVELQHIMSDTLNRFKQHESFEKAFVVSSKQVEPKKSEFDWNVCNFF